MSFNFHTECRNPKSGLYEPGEYKLSNDPVTYHEYKTGAYPDPIKSTPEEKDKKTKKDKKKKKDNSSEFTILTYNPNIERVSYIPYNLPKVDPLTGKEDNVKAEPKKKEVKKEKQPPRRIQKRTPVPEPKPKKGVPATKTSRQPVTTGPSVRRVPRK